jgi:hypothetical protein
MIKQRSLKRLFLKTDGEIANGSRYRLTKWIARILLPRGRLLSDNPLSFDISQTQQEKDYAKRS